MSEQISLTDEARAARNAYRRQWAKKNKDKVKATTARYWQRKAQQQAEQTAQEG